MRCVHACLGLVSLLTFGCSSSGSKTTDEKPDPFLTFATTTPTVGQPAPSFDLMSANGDHVKLATAVARGPVVLVFASYTCPPSRMKLPSFEALAMRWQSKAKIFVVYTREAHPHAKSSDRLNGFADQVQARDRNGDGTITLAEYGDLGPRYMFDAFDLDHDGNVKSYELLAARRLDQFKDVDAPTKIDQRFTLARRLRAQVPGQIPILVDGIDDATMTSYGGLPNMAYVIASDGRVSFKIPWAAVGDIERELARLTHTEIPAPTVVPPDLTVIRPRLDAATAAHRRLLLEFTAIGCHACEVMTKTLADPEIQNDLAGYDVAKLGIESDSEWALFESLQLVATPALVALGSDGKVSAALQGAQDHASLHTFLQSASK